MTSLRAGVRFLAVCALAATGCGDDDDASMSPDDGGARADGGDVGPKPQPRMDASTGRDSGSDAGADASDPGELREVTIRFVGRVGAEPFACGEVYDDHGTTDVEVTPLDFRFYVQDLSLLKADGTAVPVKIAERTPWQAEGVALIDFEDKTGRCYSTAETNTTITGTVPKGEYTGVSFANGVPEELNHGNPPELPAPLQMGGLAWNWLTGYRFVKAELVEDFDDGELDAGFMPGVGLAHIGVLGCSGNPGAGTVKCSHLNRNAVKLDGFDPDSNVIAADLGAIFAKSDLSRENQCHGGEEACKPMFEQLGIDIETGDALPSQQVYRVE